MYVNQVYMGSSALTKKKKEKKKRKKKVDVVSTVTSTCDRERSSPMPTFEHHTDNLIF